MIRSAVLAVTERSITKKLVTDTRAGRALAERFVAGDTLNSAIEVARSLNAKGFTVSLDHLGEHVTSVEEAQRATDDYVECLEAISSEGLDANISVKLTQLGMGVDDGQSMKNLQLLAEAASRSGTTVTIDMEESAFTSTTLDAYETVQRETGNLGIAIQSYLRRTPDDLKRILSQRGHIRLCKGAYAESPELAFSGSAVDEAFDELATTLMEAEGVRPAIASHDDARLTHVLDRAKDRTAGWEFQMLYGVRRDRQAELVAAGQSLRVYVPYGDAWYPYLTRRLAERPGNIGFFARALIGG